MNQSFSCRSFIHFICILFVFASFVGCQTPTRVSESDEGMEQRVFSKISHGKEVDLKKAIIVDVRSRFDYEMSKAPRSFFAFWKDWDLSGYSGVRLDKKAQELQRILALNGVEPLTQVVILGRGLAGEGNEFLVASTLLSLGVERISFMDTKQVRAALVARALPKVENAPAWKLPLKYNFQCGIRSDGKQATLAKKSDILISKKTKISGKASLNPKNVFTKGLKIKKQSFPKAMNLRLYSPGSHWAYGLALYFVDQGRKPCVL